MFWMDTDPELFFADAAKVCAASKYSMSEIEAIFWNEVRPAVRSNLRGLAGEWTGFEIEELAQRIRKRNRFGSRLPIKVLHPVNTWWEKLRREIETRRGQESRPK